MISVISSIEGCGNLTANDLTDLQSSGVWEPCKLPMIPLIFRSLVFRGVDIMLPMVPLIFSLLGCGKHAANDPADL